MQLACGPGGGVVGGGVGEGLGDGDGGGLMDGLGEALADALGLGEAASGSQSITSPPLDLAVRVHWSV
jgi:hypothetical protein